MTSRGSMQIALDEAYLGIDKGEGGPFGAVIVKDGKIISQDHNTVLRSNDATKHAEIRAISAASKKLGTFDLSGCEIYSTTEPCTMCFSAIHWAKIDKVIFGTRIDDVKKLGFNELPIPVEKMKELSNSNVKIKAGFMKEECIKLLNSWSVTPKKQTY